MSDAELPPELERPAELGRMMASALGTGPGRSTLAAQRAAVLGSLAALPAERRWSVPRWSWAALPAALGAIGVLAYTLSRPADLSAHVEGTTLTERQVLSAAGTRQRVLAFSDGSRVRLEPRAELELTKLSRERAEVRLRSGSLAATIQKATGRTWSILAGGYEVRVVGTAFSVAWHDEQLSVEVHEGKVLVLGAGLAPGGRALRAGERLVTPRPRSPVAPVAASSAEATPPPASGSALTPAPAAAAQRESWMSLAQKARYADALALAEQAGFDGLTQSLGDNDLLLLANTARFAGDSARAKAAFDKLRSRFPGRPAARLAALYLARIAQAQGHLPAAARWLRVFLAESPADDMASGARASLIEIALKQGDQQGARAAAADYLAHHPNGPHASQARALAAPPRR